MTRHDCTDAQLLEELAFDVNSAFERLVTTYNAQLERSVRNQIHSYEGAQDVMQECWRRIYQVLCQYSPERIRSLQLRPWLFTIVRNQANTYLKSEKKNMLMTTSIELFKDDSWEPACEEPFEEEMLGQALREEVKVALERVSPMPQDALRLYLLEDRTYEEIAQQLRKPVSTVRTLVSRGLRQLREILPANRN